MRQFKLYEPGAHFCSASDYQAIVEVVERLQPREVLEFGPGWSTLAIIEAGGVAHIDTMEDDPHWFDVWSERLRGKHPILTVRAYDWAEPLVIPAIDVLRYALGIVDGPYPIGERVACIEYCLARCKAVLVPLETSHGTFLLATVERLAKAHRRSVELMETGPFAGAFALLT